jgi:hypothetical protein
VEGSTGSNWFWLWTTCNRRMVPTSYSTLISSYPLPKVNNSLPPLKGRKEESLESTRIIITTTITHYIPYCMYLQLLQTSIDDLLYQVWLRLLDHHNNHSTLLHPPTSAPNHHCSASIQLDLQGSSWSIENKILLTRTFKEERTFDREALEYHQVLQKILHPLHLVMEEKLEVIVPGKALYHQQLLMVLEQYM